MVNLHSDRTLCTLQLLYPCFYNRPVWYGADACCSHTRYDKMKTQDAGRRRAEMGNKERNQAQYRNDVFFNPFLLEMRTVLQFLTSSANFRTFTFLFCMLSTSFLFSSVHNLGKIAG